MATKVTPKKVVSTAKPTTKGIEDKENQAAARTKLIEAGAEILSPIIAERDELTRTGESKFLEIADTVIEQIQENDFTKAEARQMVILAISEARDIHKDEISMKSESSVGRSSYTYVSKIISLAIPKDKNAEKEVAKARAKNLPIDWILGCATGNKTAAGAPVGAGKGKGSANQHKGADGTKKVNGKAVIEDKEIAGNEFAALISRMTEGGLTCDEIDEIFAEQMMDTRKTLGQD